MMNVETLFNAAAVMTKAGEEIDAMLEELYTLLSEELKKVEDVSDVRLTKEKEEEMPNDWVWTGCLKNYGIFQESRRRRSTPSGYIGIQIKLCDESEAEIVGPQPLLYVMFSGDGGWGMDEFLLSTALSEKYELQDGWLWQWNEEGEDLKDGPWGKKSYWAFVLPLVALNTPEDLKAMVVEPAKNIMNGGLDPKKLDKRILRFKVKDSQVSLS